MKTILSINNKFFEIDPKELIELVQESDKVNAIKGFELNVDNSNDEEKEYSIKFAKVCSKEEYILRLHAPALSEVSDYNKYFDFVNEISKIMNSKINVVLHPITDTNIEKSKLTTIQYLQEIYNYLREKRYDNIKISLENLNNLPYIERLKKENLEDILDTYSKLKFTYDIGHELIENRVNSNLSDILQERLNNIHVHTYEDNNDHYPITDLDSKANEILKSLKELAKNGYIGYIVPEYSIDYIGGKDLQAKIVKYVQYATFLNEVLENF